MKRKTPCLNNLCAYLVRVHIQARNFTAANKSYVQIEFETII